jgi:hypothetical protein
MKSKKIAILTFQNTLNYGAMLQCFALNRTLNDMKYECKTIDYECKAVVNREMPFSFIKSKDIKNIIKGILSLGYKVKKRNAFHHFFLHDISHSSNHYTRKSINECSSKFDTFIVGSDQVWNPIVTGCDKTFFLDFVEPGTKKIAYAASFGDKQYFSDYSNIFKDLINSFDFISVREKEAVLFAETFCKKPIQQVCDPVFLLKVDQWRKYEKPIQTKMNYILVYFIHYDYCNTMKTVKKFARDNNYDIIYVNNTYKLEKDVTNIRDASPEQFLYLVDNASLVVTGSFHGYSLSLIYNKPVYYEKTLSPTRVSEIASYVGFEDKTVETLTTGDVDFKYANERITDLTTESIQYIINALE